MAKKTSKAKGAAAERSSMLTVAARDATRSKAALEAEELVPQKMGYKVRSSKYLFLPGHVP